MERLLVAPALRRRHAVRLRVHPAACSLLPTSAAADARGRPRPQAARAAMGRNPGIPTARGAQVGGRRRGRRRGGAPASGRDMRGAHVGGDGRGGGEGRAERRAAARGCAASAGAGAGAGRAGVSRYVTSLGHSARGGAGRTVYHE